MNSPEPLFEPDPNFAEQWSVDDPVAQGALKHASVAILDSLREAADELRSPRPDLGDEALAIFPAGLRPALTPLLVEKLTAAATVVGWKLAQPGSPIIPMCLAEEFVLELVRREAIFVLELAEADSSSIAATRGVFEVCEDDDVLDLFSMQEPADAALALESPINRQMGKADMRIEHWFDPFYGGRRGAPHPVYAEPEEPPTSSPSIAMPLEAIEPGDPLDLEREMSDAGFRVVLRLWDDAFLERDPTNQMAATWTYYLQTRSADASLREVLERFPGGATREIDTERAEETRLDRDDLARISVDVQRVHLPQLFSDGRSFHIIGRFQDALDRGVVAHLTANLTEAFSQVVVLSDGDRHYFGLSLNAESHEEAEANLDDLLTSFANVAGLPDDGLDGSTIGQGSRSFQELVEEIEIYRREE